MTDYSEKFEKMRIAGKLAAETLDMYPNLYATITLQHLEITLDDVAG